MISGRPGNRQERLLPGVRAAGLDAGETVVLLITQDEPADVLASARRFLGIDLDQPLRRERSSCSTIGRTLSPCRLSRASSADTGLSLS